MGELEKRDSFVTKLVRRDTVDTREERKPHPSISILRNEGLGGNPMLFIDGSKEEVFHHSEKPCCGVQQGQREECAPGDLERRVKREIGSSLWLKAGKPM